MKEAQKVHDDEKVAAQTISPLIVLRFLNRKSGVPLISLAIIVLRLF